jgi:hypothetical protein
MTHALQRVNVDDPVYLILREHLLLPLSLGLLNHEASLSPALDNLVLGTQGDPCSIEDLSWS